MEEFLLNWLHTRIQPRVRERTYQSYHDLITKQVLPTLGHVKVHKLLLALKWDDIDLTHGKIQVRHTLSRIPGQGVILSEPKTPSSRRCIHLTTTALEALKQLFLQQEQVKRETGTPWGNQQWVFCNGQGKPLDAGNLLRRSFRPLLSQANVPAIRFHDLRHTTATLLLALGTHPKIVQELLGHSQISMTLDIYSHVLPTLQESAMTHLNTLLATQDLSLLS